MPVLCANLVYLSFDRTSNQAIEGGLYKRDLRKKKKVKKEIVKIQVSPGSVAELWTTS